MQSRQRQTNTTFTNINDKINRSKNNNSLMTTCNKGGIKIKEAGNGYSVDPFEGVDPFRNPNPNEDKNTTVIYDNSNYEKMDLNINNYNREDLFSLFGLKNKSLTEEIMKECKKIVLKTHPDKSRIDEKYFIFFSSAYKKLLGIYEFQNKTNSKKTSDTNEYFDKNNVSLLDQVFEAKKDLKDPKNFNSWFNEQFDKHKLEDTNETGYGSWLKSDEDIVYLPNVNKANMASEIEKRKKQVQSMTTYNGVSDQYSSAFGGSALMSYDSNFTSGSLFSNDGMGYTDLRQAYVESVIPVTEDDFHKTKQFKSVDEYKRHRETIDTNPINTEEAMRQLYQENKQKDEESTALAFYYAQQAEKAKKNQDNFWSGLKQLTNW
jgi:curved DNA-binding protein CbpA